MLDTVTLTTNSNYCDMYLSIWLCSNFN